MPIWQFAPEIWIELLVIFAFKDIQQQFFGIFNVITIDTK